MHQTEESELKSQNIIECKIELKYELIYEHAQGPGAGNQSRPHLCLRVSGKCELHYVGGSHQVVPR